MEFGLTHLSLNLPTSLVTELNKRSRAGHGSVSDLVPEAVAAFLEKPLHTLFQVSMSRSLVAGKYGGVITCDRLLEYGDFGLGRFAGPTGEMIIADRHVFRIEDNGRITEALPSDEAPLATIMCFNPTVDKHLESVTSFDDLTLQLDRFRRSDSLFYAIRLDGRCQYVKTKAVYLQEPGTSPPDTAMTQHEFTDTNGSLVGI